MDECTLIAPRICIMAGLCTLALAWARISVLTRRPLTIRREDGAPLSPWCAAQLAPWSAVRYQAAPQNDAQQSSSLSSTLRGSGGRPATDAAAANSARPALDPLFAEVQADLEAQPHQSPVEGSGSDRDCPTLLVHVTAQRQLNLSNGSDAFSALWRHNLGLMPKCVSLQYYNDARMLRTAKIVSALVWRAGLTEGVRSAYEAFRRLRPPAYRADLWRYMVLWAKGGVYLDAKIRLVKPLGQIFDLSSSALQIGRDKLVGAYWQGAFAAIAPRHKGLANVIRQVVCDVNARRYFPGWTSLRLTGPQAIFVAAGPSDCELPRAINEGPWKCNETSTIKIIGALRSVQADDTTVALGICRGDTFKGLCPLLLRYDLGVHRDQHTNYGGMFEKRQIYCDDLGPPDVENLCELARD